MLFVAKIISSGSPGPLVIFLDFLGVAKWVQGPSENPKYPDLGKYAVFGVHLTGILPRIHLGATTKTRECQDTRTGTGRHGRHLNFFLFGVKLLEIN